MTPQIVMRGVREMRTVLGMVETNETTMIGISRHRYLEDKEDGITCKVKLETPLLMVFMTLKFSSIG